VASLLFLLRLLNRQQALCVTEIVCSSLTSPCVEHEHSKDSIIVSFKLVSPLHCSFSILHALQKVKQPPWFAKLQPIRMACTHRFSQHLMRARIDAS
jgi:hypothetical protein